MIKINNLSFDYSKKSKTIKNLNLEIKAGKWISILGHNGSGKSTLAKLLVGLLSPKKGSIHVCDIELNEDTIFDIRKKIGIVFQNPDNQFVGVTVKYDIAFGLENQNMSSKEIKERVFKYAKIVGMENYLDKEPHLLSGGQKQRVAIAGALAMDQQILILDEATSMLDPKGTNEIIDLIKRVNKDHNKTIITITHDLDFAKKSDYIFVLNQGELVLEGSPSKVFKHEDILIKSNLELPVGLEVYKELKDKNNINKKLVNALWEYNSKM